MRVVGKEGVLGAGVGGNCSSGMDGSMRWHAACISSSSLLDSRRTRRDAEEAPVSSSSFLDQPSSVMMIVNPCCRSPRSRFEAPQQSI